MIVARQNLATGRVVGPQVDRHTALPFRHKGNGRDELAGLVTVACRINQPERRAVLGAQRLTGHVHRQHHPPGEHLLDSKVLKPLIGAIDTDGAGGFRWFGDFKQLPEAKAAPIGA